MEQGHGWNESANQKLKKKESVNDANISNAVNCLDFAVVTSRATSYSWGKTAKLQTKQAFNKEASCASKDKEASYFTGSEKEP